jgi:hypothetical protein
VTRLLIRLALAFVGLGPAGGAGIDRFQVGAFDYLLGPSLLADFVEKSRGGAYVTTLFVVMYVPL